MKVVVSSSPPSLFTFSHHRHNYSSTHLRTPHNLHQHKLLCSSSSSSSVDGAVDSGKIPDALPFSGCKGCGKEQVERGCNGEGRIQGGIATIPGFGWWPIKAYRPCPGFLASGGNYRRRGQSMDEVAFGRGKG